jgi:hypothetical protein
LRPLFPFLHFHLFQVWDMTRLRIDGLGSTNLSEKLTAVFCYISNSTKQQIYLNWIHAAVLSRYCLLLKRMQLTFGVSLDDGREGNNRSCETRVSVTAWPTCHWSPFVKCFIYNKPEVKFMHVEYYRKKLTHTHKTRPHLKTVGFPQPKELPRSTANSTVSLGSTESWTRSNHYAVTFCMNGKRTSVIHIRTFDTRCGGFSLGHYHIYFAERVTLNT